MITRQATPIDPFADYQRLSDEVKGDDMGRPDIVQTNYGPCQAMPQYAVLTTNQLGELQLHPCTLCRKAFVFSETYGFLGLRKDTALSGRARELLKQAIAEGVFPSDTSFE
jgi:hypothetical protein